MLSQLWYGRSALRWVLWPFSQLYKLIVTTKAFLYKSHLLKTYTFDVPVIVVGNITVGGTGKTPFCIALCDYLKSQGRKPGLVSRGYGGQATTWPQLVTADSDPAWVGDEPVLLVQRTGCPMVVGPDRVAAVRHLLQHFSCDVVISDDGLQHYRMGRQVEIVITDATRGLGNGLCLPAGPLRESATRLKSVDFVVKNGSEAMQITYGDIYSLIDPSRKLNLSDAVNKSIVAIAAIGHPERFFVALKQMGFKLETKVFRDHYRYEPHDLQTIDADIILMTEKDAVKCRRFADQRCYVLPIQAKVPANLLSSISALTRSN